MYLSSLSESLGSLLAATVAFAIGASVVLRDRSREQFVLFAVFCVNLALFNLARFFHLFAGIAFFGWVAQTVSLLLPWTADRCFSSFVPAVGHRRGHRLQTAIVAALMVAQAVALLFPVLTTRRAWEVVPIALTAYVVGGLVYATTRIWRAAKAAEGTATAPRLRYLFYASIAALALGSPIVPAIGPIVTAVYLYFVAQTLIRERLLELPEVVGRIVSMTGLVIIVTAFYLLLLVWVPTTAGGSRSLFMFNAAVASFAVIVLMDPIRTEVESRVESWLFRERSLLQPMLVNLRHKLVNVIDPDDAVELVIDELRHSNRVTHASLYLLDRFGTSLTLRGHLGPSVPATLSLAKRRPLLERMLDQGPQLRDVIQRLRDRAASDRRAELAEMLETFDVLGASLALPITGRPPQEGEARKPELLGALFVGDERLLEAFSRPEIALFQGVVDQTATTLQNSAVYEERRERDRLQRFLALIALRSDPQHRSRLAFELWPESEERQARTNLRKLLHHLRQSLPDLEEFIEIEHEVVWWLPSGPSEVDVLRFRDAIAAGHLELAARLYAGDLLPASYDDWVLDERTRLRSEARRALAQLARQAAKLDDHKTTLGYAERVLDLEPTDEAIVEIQMAAYLAEGDKASALRAYHRYAAVLERDLDAEPGESVHAIYRTLRSAVRGRGDMPRNEEQAPVAQSAFVGRSAEWNRLHEIWSGVLDSGAHLVLLTGEPGIGKSRLAEEFGRRVRSGAPGWQGPAPTRRQVACHGAR